MSTKILCVMLFLGVSIKSEALSLSEVIRMARQQSIEAQIALKMFQNNELSYKHFKAERKPQVIFSATPMQYSKDVVQRYSYDEDRTYYRAQNNLYSSANIRAVQNVDFLGGYFYVDSDFRIYNTLSGNRFKQFTTIPLRIGYSQNLIGHNPFKWQNRIARLSYSIAEKLLLHSLEEISADAIERYLAVALLREERVLAESNLHNCKILCSEAEKKLRYGRLSKKEYAELKLEQSKAFNACRQVDINLIEAESMLHRLLNLKDEVELEVSMQDIVQRLNLIIEIPMSEAIRHALDNSTDLLATKRKVVEAARDVDRQKIKRFFDATVNVSFGLHQISETIKGTYKRPLDEETFSLSLSIPLADFGRGRILHAQARNNLDIKRMEIEKAEEDVREQIRKRIQKHLLLYNMIGSAKETYLLSCVAYDDVLAEYHLGRWSVNALGNAVVNREMALVEYYRSIKDYLVNYAQIRNMTLYDFEKKENIALF